MNNTNHNHSVTPTNSEEIESPETSEEQNDVCCPIINVDFVFMIH